MNNIDDMIDFFLYEKGENIRINGEDQIALIVDTVDKINYYDDEIIRCKHQIKTGDIVEYNELKYLITSEINKDQKSEKARMRKCNYFVKIIVDGKVNEFPSIITSQSFSLNTEGYISSITGRIEVTIQENNISNEIDETKRFIKMGKAWKIVGIDRTKAGLITLICDIDLFNSLDDVEEEIADRWKYEVKHEYTITVVPDNIIINEGVSTQLSVTVKDGTEDIISPEILYSSNNANVVSVNNVGVVSAILEGSAEITVSFTGQDNKEYIKTVIVTVQKILDNFTWDIIPNLSMGWIIKKSNTNTFTAKKYNNGTEILDVPFDFTINYNDISQSSISIIEETDAYIKIKNVSIDTTSPAKTIELTAIERGTSNSVTKTITLKGIYG